MLVALDTNAMIAANTSNQYFDGTYVEALLAFLRNTGGLLLLSDVVLREYAERARNGFYSTQLARVIEACSDPHLRQALALQSVPPLARKDETLDRIITSWLSALRSRLADVLVDVPHSNEVLEEALTRAIVKKRPVVKQDAGFKDAVIWLSILEYLERNTPEAPVAFISSDGGFGEDGARGGDGPLHPDLLAECMQRNLDIRRYATIQKFVQEHVDDVRRDFAWLTTRMQQPDVTSFISTYYFVRGPLIHLEALETFSDNQVRTGVPTVVSFAIKGLREAYMLAQTGSTSTLALVLEVSGEIVSNTYDRRIRGDYLTPGELPERDERHRFSPTPTLQATVEIRDDDFRVLRVEDWEPSYESDGGWFPRTAPDSRVGTT